MIAMSQRDEIRRMKEVEGLGTRQIAERLGISRTTVRAQLSGKRSGDNKYHRTVVHADKLGPHKEALEGLIEVNEKLSVKNRRTGRALFEELQEKGYEGAYDSVQRHIKRWREERHLQRQEAFMPLVFAPGEAGQFDFGTDTVWVKGVRTVVKAARFKLCCSGLSLVQVYPTERQEVVMEAMRRGFEFFGGVPQRTIIDNMSTAVKRILTRPEQEALKKKREWTEAFEEFCGYYLTKPDACNAGRGNEKGQVEREVQLSRDAYFKQQLRGDSLEEINDRLASRCLEHASRKRHPKVKSRTILEVFREEEQGSLIALPPQPHPCCLLKDQRKVDRYCTVAFDANRYSVPSQYVGYHLEVRGYVFRVEVVHRGVVVAHHERLYGKGQTAFDGMHYLKVLKKKPATLNNGAPIVNWALPPVFESARRRLNQALRQTPWEGDRAFIDVLMVLEEYPLEEVTAALELAMDKGTPQAGVVRNLLSRLLEETPAVEPLEQATALKLEPLANPSLYDHLLRQGAEA